MSLDESTVEEMALGWFSELSYAIGHGPRLAPGEPAGSGWWLLYRNAEDYIAECERRWRAAQHDALSPEQEAWVHWARETAKSVCPFDSGYPDPTRDGTFDPATLAFGGPYPTTRNFPTPPTMPEIPAPVVVQQGYGAPAYQPTPKPYPFWLKYQRR